MFARPFIHFMLIMILMLSTLALIDEPLIHADHTPYGTSWLQVRDIFNQNLLIFCLLSPWNKMLCYSSEAHHKGASNEYPQHMFSWRNKKNTMWIPPLIWSYDVSNRKKEKKLQIKCFAQQKSIDICHIYPSSFQWVHVYTTYVSVGKCLVTRVQLFKANNVVS